LFIILLLLFLVVTPTIIFYSQGYRFDWAAKKITQTGAFYFKVVPSRADVFINGTFVKKTDFFFDSVLLGDLLPKPYFVRIQKEGYIPWTKSLKIKPKEVAEAKNIILFPSHIQFKSVLENVKDFWSSPDGKKIVFEKVNPGQKWQLYLWDLETNDQKIIARQKNNESVGEVIWSQDSSRILVNNSAIWNLTGGANDQCVKTSCDEKSFAQKNPNILFSSVKQNMQELLLRFDTKKTIEKKFSSPGALVLSPDKRKIAIANDSEIWIYYIEDQNEEPTKKAMDLTFLSKLSAKPNNLVWLNDHELIFSIGNAIKISEIDERDSLNVVDIATYPVPKLFWQDQNKTLTVLSEGKVSVSEKLIR